MSLFPSWARSVGQSTLKRIHRHSTGTSIRSQVTATASAVKDDSTQVESRTSDVIWTNDLSNALPYSEVPHEWGQSLLLTLYNMYKYKGRGHLSHQEKFQKFGPIYKELIMGKHDFVFTSDVESIERLLRLEGRIPQRLMMEPWRQWREKNGHAFGILISDGERWKRMRTALDKQLLRPKTVGLYADDVNDVVTDFIHKIRKIRQPDMFVEKIDIELFHWSLETVGTILYERRFGILSDTEGNRNEFADFVQAVHDMFVSTEKVTFMTDLVKKTFGKKWHIMHEKAWDVIFDTTKKLIDGKLQELELKMKNNEEVTGFLSTLMASQKLSIEEVYGNVSELMAASVDTTSNTMQWCLYQLSRNPQYQDMLYEEQKRILPDSKVPSYEDLQHMPMLKAVIKETVRLYPIAGVVTRTLTEDFNICGYRVPKGTHIIASSYSIGRDPKYYTDPDSFKPDRWLRSSEAKKMNTYAFLPFGHGPRMCVGKRIAELEMHLLLARLVREFKIQKVNDRPYEICSKALLYPERAVEVKLIDR